MYINNTLVAVQPMAANSTIVTSLTISHPCQLAGISSMPREFPLNVKLKSFNFDLFFIFSFIQTSFIFPLFCATPFSHRQALFKREKLKLLFF